MAHWWNYKPGHRRLVLAPKQLMLRRCGDLSRARPNHCIDLSLVQMNCDTEGKQCILIPWCGYVLFLGRWFDGRQCPTKLCSDWCAQDTVLHVMCAVVHYMWCVQSSCNVVDRVHVVLQLLWAMSFACCSCCERLRASAAGAAGTMCGSCVRRILTLDQPCVFRQQIYV